MLKLSLVFKKYLFWWVLMLVVVIPLYPKFPLFNVPGTYVAIRLEDFLIAAAIGWWIVVILPYLKNFFKDTLTQAFFLFWAIGALSLFSGIFLTQTVIFHLGFLHYLRRIEMMMLFFVAATAITSIRQIKLLLVSMFVVGLVVILYGFGQQWLSFPVISTTNKEFSKGLILFLSPDARVNSTFAGHYDLAAYLSVFLVILLAFLFYFKDYKLKIIAVLTGLLGFVLLALTAARVSFLAMVLGTVVLICFLGQKKLIFVILTMSLLAFVISPDLRHRTVATLTVNLLGGGGAKYTPPPQKSNPTKTFSIENAIPGFATPAGVPVDIAPGEPLNTTELGVYRSFGIRLNEEWPRAIRAFTKNPLLGTGYSSISIASDNDYLRSLGETGLLGTISFILIFTLLIKKIWNTIRKSSKNLFWYLNLGLLCSLVTLAITALFIDVLESSKIAQLLWLILGVNFASSNLDQSEKKPLLKTFS